MENNRKEGEIRIDTQRETYKTIAQGLKVQQQATSEVLINNNDGRKAAMAMTPLMTANKNRLGRMPPSPSSPSSSSLSAAATVDTGVVDGGNSR